MQAGDSVFPELQHSTESMHFASDEEWGSSFNEHSQLTACKQIQLAMKSACIGPMSLGNR